MNLENKIALITGSTRGIGKSIAKLFVQNGATVIICGRNIENSKKTIEEIANENTLKGLFAKEILEEIKNKNYDEEIIEQALEMGMEILE